MERRRPELVRLLDRRRRRLRLLLVCVATALACGLVAGLAGSRILIGGVAYVRGAPAGADGPADAAAAPTAAMPLDLSASLNLDPREGQANAIRWQGLPDSARRAALDRYWRIAEMEGQERNDLLQRYAAFRELPEKRQEFLRTRAHRLEAFMKTLSPQDQAVLEGMSDEARARRLLDLWQARYGTW